MSVVTSVAINRKIIKDFQRCYYLILILYTQAKYAWICDQLHEAVCEIISRNKK